MSSAPADIEQGTLARVTDPLLPRKQVLNTTTMAGIVTGKRVTPSDSSWHSEKHSDNTAFVRDAIIGFADGLTVPFALTAGLSSVGSSRLVIIGGLAELFAGSISMGLGAYLASLTDAKHYHVEELRERREVEECPLAEEEEIYDIFSEFQIEREAVKPIVESLKANKEMWVSFMMKFELGLECPATSRLYFSALVMGLSYFIGGLIPMIPYFAINNINFALLVSVVVTVVMLLAFGFVKAIITGTDYKDAARSAIQTLTVGMAAASVSYGIVKGIDSYRPSNA